MFYYLSLFLFLMLHPLESSNPEIIIPVPEHWNVLLGKYVDKDGNVDYIGLKSEESVLKEYLVSMGENPPSESASSKDQLVYYINLYNAATVKLILENYPLKSIKDIKSPWARRWIRVGENIVSLGDIEHKILRKLGEPRIHFAINCASYSCPKLINEAYTLENLEQQLETATWEFINDPKRNRISAEGAEVSEIFKWYKSDFTEHGSLKDYINNYSEQRIDEEIRLKYIKYDWSLNEKK